MINVNEKTKALLNSGDFNDYELALRAIFKETPKEDVIANMTYKFIDDLQSRVSQVSFHVEGIEDSLFDVINCIKNDQAKVQEAIDSGIGSQVVFVHFQAHSNKVNEASEVKTYIFCLTVDKQKEQVYDNLYNFLLAIDGEDTGVTAV